MFDSGDADVTSCATVDPTCPFAEPFARRPAKPVQPACVHDAAHRFPRFFVRRDNVANRTAAFAEPLASKSRCEGPAIPRTRVRKGQGLRCCRAERARRRAHTQRRARSPRARLSEWPDAGHRTSPRARQDRPRSRRAAGRRPCRCPPFEPTPPPADPVPPEPVPPEPVPPEPVPAAVAVGPAVAVEVDETGGRLAITAAALEPPP